jgi:predicted permease
VEHTSARLEAASPAIFAATVPPNWARDEQTEYAKMRLTARAAAGGSSGLRTTYKDALVVLLVVVGTVLLIGCANVANLLLARAAARQHELAVRLAIGAGRGRLVRQLLTESLLLSFAGGAAGLLFARWAGGLLVRFLSTRTNAVFVDLTLDTRVLLFSIAIATISGLLFGLLPAWRVSRVDPQSAMKAQGRGVAHGGNRFGLGRVLVVGQVALSLVLVVAAGLLVGSFRKLVTMDPGFRREGVLLASMNLATTGWPEAQRRSVHRQVLERLRALPGVEAVGASYTTPLGNSSWNDVVAVPGYDAPTAQDSVVMFNAVSEGWFEALGTGLVAGRDFQPGEGKSGALVAVINETMAQRFFRHPAPLGRRFQTRTADSLNPPMEIVGVVRDAKYQSLREDNPPTVYVPMDQGEWYGTRINYQLRTANPAGLIPVISSLAGEFSPSISLEYSTLAEQVGASLRRPRLLATLSGFFAMLALILAVVGLYGMVAYGVTRRRGEIGIRLALGAARTRVLGMVLGEAGRLVVAGLVLGVAASLATTRLLQSFLYGLAPNDPVTLTFSALALVSVALLASAIPAWRAASLDPTLTLREE